METTHSVGNPCPRSPMDDTHVRQQPAVLEATGTVASPLDTGTETVRISPTEAIHDRGERLW